MHQDVAKLKSKIEQKNAKVAIVGFGYIGSCIGAVIADKGFDVVGIDVRKNLVDEMNRGTISINEPGLNELIARTVAAKKLRATTDYGAIRDCDVVVVTVGTPLGANFDPDTRDIVAASESIAKHIRDGQLIVLKSTVPPRTTDDVVRPILERNAPADARFYLAFCPERLAEGRAIIELKTIPVVVGGIDEVSTEMASEFWRSVLEIETIKVDNAVAAELVKLADNLWIDLNVALANEVALLSEKLKVDALQVIEAANSLPKGQHYVNILAPSIGVGGYCLTKDPWFVHHLGKGFGLELKTPVASRTANDAMPAYSFELIRQTLAEQGKELANCKVAVLGIAFKNNTGDCRFTPTKPIIERLEQSGCDLMIHDPWVHEAEAKTVTSCKLSGDLIETLRGADAVLFFTGHDEFKKITIPQLRELVKPGAFLLDGRNFFTREKIKEAREAGFVYKGIGR